MWNFFSLYTCSTYIYIIYIYYSTIYILEYEFNTHTYIFPDSSAGKESTCNAGDPSLIPGMGRSPGEGIGYPL